MAPIFNINPPHEGFGLKTAGRAAALDSYGAFGKTKDQAPLTQWPADLDSKLCWEGAEYANSALYTYSLTEAEVQEANDALKHFKSLELGGNEVDRGTFPLPTLGPKLSSLSMEVHAGRGFCNIRGLNPELYSPEDNVLFYLGFSSYFGEVRAKQDHEGRMLAHVREANLSKTNQQERPFRDSNLKLTFHTDGFTDILGMQTRSLAARGGNHIIASSYKICSELAKTRPDLLEVLATPNWYFDHRGKFQDHRPRAVVFYQDGHLIMNYIRYPSGWLRKHSSVEALDYVEALAKKYQLILDMQPGDMTFVNNWAILHSRDAFEDDETHVRYLVRIWLRNEKLAWSLPPILEHGNRAVYYDAKLEDIWNIVPEPRLHFELFQTLAP